MFRTPFTRKTSDTMLSNCVSFKEPSKVKESLSYACDIQTIYDNYCRTGHLPLNGKQPLYDENFVKLDSLIDAQQLVREATEYFAGLPGDVRAHYGNSLEKFVSAVHSNDEYLFDKGVKIRPGNENVNINIKNPSVQEPSVPSVEPSTPSTPSQVNTAETGTV